MHLCFASNNNYTHKYKVYVTCNEEDDPHVLGIPYYNFIGCCSLCNTATKAYQERYYTRSVP